LQRAPAVNPAVLDFVVLIHTLTLPADFPQAQAPASVGLYNQFGHFGSVFTVTPAATARP
jgi:hypothetical protein